MSLYIEELKTTSHIIFSVRPVWCDIVWPEIRIGINSGEFLNWALDKNELLARDKGLKFLNRARDNNALFS